MKTDFNINSDFDMEKQSISIFALKQTQLDIETEFDIVSEHYIEKKFDIETEFDVKKEFDVNQDSLYQDVLLSGRV